MKTMSSSFRQLIRRSVLVACLVGAASCQRAGVESGTPEDTAAPPDAGAPPDSEAACLVGWWTDPVAWGCNCPGRAECAAADCQAHSLRGFRADGSYYSLIVTTSKTTGTMSTIGSVNAARYETNGSELSLIRTKARNTDPYRFSCKGSKVTLDYFQHTRVDGALAEAINAQLAEGKTTWSGVRANGL